MSVNINTTVSDGILTHKESSSNADYRVTQMQHLHKVSTDFGIASTAAPAADVEKIVFRATGDAVIRRVDAMLLDTGTSTDVKFDLLKASAGSPSTATVLSATMDFVHGDTDNTAKPASVSNTALIAGDVLVAHMDYTSATGANGPMLNVQVTQDQN